MHGQVTNVVSVLFVMRVQVTDAEKAAHVGHAAVNEAQVALPLLPLPYRAHPLPSSAQ